MENENTNSDHFESESQIAKRARKHIGFKIHLCIYVLVIAFFWLLWFFIFKNQTNGENSVFLKLSWAVTLFWLLFIIMHYLVSYKWNKSYLEKEIARMKEKHKKLLKQLDEIKAMTDDVEKSISQSENNQ